MTNSLHFSEWRNCIRAQRKVNLCAPGAPKGPKVGMFVRQYEIVCANDAGRAPRKYPECYVYIMSCRLKCTCVNSLCMTKYYIEHYALDIGKASPMISFASFIIAGG